MLVFGLVEALKPLHANRTGHKAAGLWLAAHSQPADPVLDPFCWAHFYAGRVFLEGKVQASPPGYHPTQYVVLENSDHEHIRLPDIPQANSLANRGKVVYFWPENKPEASAKVLVFAVPIQR